jgi:hypothetical protein
MSLGHGHANVTCGRFVRIGRLLSGMVDCDRRNTATLVFWNPVLLLTTYYLWSKEQQDYGLGLCPSDLLSVLKVWAALLVTTSSLLGPTIAADMPGCITLPGPFPTMTNALGVKAVTVSRLACLAKGNSCFA